MAKNKRRIIKCIICGKKREVESSNAKYCLDCIKKRRIEKSRKYSKKGYWKMKKKMGIKAFRALRNKWRKNGDKRNPLRNRERALKGKYKITLDDYNKLLKKQGGVCAICGGKPQKKNYVVDHDHNCCPGLYTCGKCIRGLLCDKCNTALGRFDESPEILQKALNYLNKGYITI